MKNSRLWRDDFRDRSLSPEGGWEGVEGGMVGGEGEWEPEEEEEGW